VRDGVWEEMVRQAWRDYLNTVNRKTTKKASITTIKGLSTKSSEDA